MAITDYIREHKTPTLSLAGADDLTQRRPNPYFLRPSAASSQAMHVMGHYAAKEMGKKKAITIDCDFAFGYEQEGGFQAAFEKDGGCVANKLWAPLGTPDYTPYLAQMSGMRRRSARALPVRARCAFMKQYANFGLKFPVVTGETGGDDALLHAFGDEAVGMMSACPYTLDLETDGNKKFAQAMVKDFNVVPGFYAAGLYINCQVVEAGLEGAGGSTDGQGEVHGRAQGREAQGHAARADQLRPSRQRRRQLLRPPHRKECEERPTASSSGTRRSRPTRTSASSGPGRRRSSSRTRSIRATIRR